MAVRIEAVGLSRNPVTVRESLIVSVTIVTHGYLGKSTNAGMKSYTNGQLRLRGGIRPQPCPAYSLQALRTTWADLSGD